MIKGKDGTVIPKVVIERLPRYYRYFDWLDNQGEKISSKNLGDLMGSSASQVRLDLSYFGDFGQQGYGYNIKKLKSELAKILRINSRTNTIIIGVGNVGRALTRYKPFSSSGIYISALFDIKPSIIGEMVNNIMVHDIKNLAEYVTVNNIEIAIMAVPKEIANEIASSLVKCGIKGILNFAPLDLDLRNKIPVENIHIIDKILALSFMIKERPE
ncbi:MAG TPA: redox-sensing transcriptional repressor Rex [Spirochaetes bacterium]|nr:redox-sensing transcriptional repressor Rex [Spirochaetota bacterium]